MTRPSAADASEAAKTRYFCIGWRAEDKQLHYYDALFDTWHEANDIAKQIARSFIDTTTSVQECPECGGSGKSRGLPCGTCHGKGIVRK